MKTGLSVYVALSSLFMALSNAQTPAKPSFDVATVKAEAAVQPGETYNANLGSVRNGRLTMGNVTLSDALKFAYGIVSDNQVAGPDWIKSRDVRFAIVGQAPPDTPQDRILLMLQTLLADRLKLKLRHEQRELPFFALVVTRNGHKLRPPKEGTQTWLGPGRITHPRMPMSVLATLLSRFERQTVMNLTELEGAFDFDLQWVPDALRGRANPDGTPLTVNGQVVDTNGPSLYTAIQEQLGLRLDSRKGPIDVLVVDQAEKVPAAN